MEIIILIDNNYDLCADVCAADRQRICYCNSDLWNVVMFVAVDDIFLR